MPAAAIALEFNPGLRIIAAWHRIHISVTCTCDSCGILIARCCNVQARSAGKQRRAVQDDAEPAAPSLASRILENMERLRPSAMAIFDKALDITSPVERADYLNAACVHQPELRQQIDIYLAAYEKGGNSRDAPAKACIFSGCNPARLIVRLVCVHPCYRPGEVVASLLLLAQLPVSHCQEEPVEARPSLAEFHRTLERIDGLLPLPGSVASRSQRIPVPSVLGGQVDGFLC